MKNFSIFLILFFSQIALAQTTSFRYEGRLQGAGLTGAVSGQTFTVALRRPDLCGGTLATWNSGSTTLQNGAFSISPTFTASSLANVMDPKNNFGAGCSTPYYGRQIYITWDQTGESFAIDLEDSPRATLAAYAIDAARIGDTKVESSLACTADQILRYNGATLQLECQTLALAPADIPTLTSSHIPALTLVGDVTGNTGASVVSGIRGVSVSATAPNAGEVLKLVGGVWTPSPDSTGVSSDADYTAKGLVKINTDQATSGLYISGGVLALPNVVTAGGVGSASQVPIINYDLKGRITSTSSAAYQDATTTQKGVVEVGSNLSISSGVISLTGSNVLNALAFTPMKLAGGESMTGTLGLFQTAGDPATGTWGAAQKGYAWFNTSSDQVKYWDGSAVKAVGVSGAGITSLGGLNGGTQTFAAGAAGTAPAIASSGTIHTLNVPLASGTGVTSGTISKTEYDAFNAKLGAASTFSGDVSGTSSTMSVDKIKGKGISAATAANQMMLYDGTNWINNVMSGDATMLSTGAITLKNTGTPGTFKSVTTDDQGRVTAGTNPSTLSGYGITNAIENLGGTQGIQSGADASKPPASIAGRVYIATDSGKIYRDDGTIWLQLSNNNDASTLSTGTLPAGRLPAFTGDVTSVAGSSALTLGTVPTGKGGTGLTSAGAANQILGMNSGPTGLEYKTIVGGTNVSIAHSANSITINATAGGSGDITDVVAGSGLSGGAATGSATLSIGAGTGIIVNTDTIEVDVGTTSGQIVQVQAGGKLPALDGSALTNLDAGDIAAGILPIARGGTNAATANDALNNLLPSQATHSGKVLSTDGTNTSWIAGNVGTVTSVTSTNNYLSVATSTSTPALTINVGTVADTVAAGNDARIVGAVQSTNYNADLAPAALCTNVQTPYWNTVSDLWACQNINFPLAAAAPNLVRVATTANITLSNTQTVDGVSLAANDRVLVKNQSATTDNGIYLVQSGAWTRASDFNSWGQLPGYTVNVLEGATWANATFRTNTPAVGAFGTDAIVWAAVGHSKINNNTAFGVSTLNKMTTGTNNTAFGSSALSSSTSAGGNTAIGSLALLSATTGANNTAVGTNTLAGTTTGTENNASGYFSMVSNSTGSKNTAVGTRALQTNVAKSESTAIGAYAMQYAFDNATVSIPQNTAVGAYALRGSVTPSSNSGTGNTALGHSALTSNTSGSSNSAVGSDALKLNTTGYGNSVQGSYALTSNTSGNENVAIGMAANFANTTGNKNTAIGTYALRENKANNESTAIGAYSMYNANDSVGGGSTYNTAVGAFSLYGNSGPPSGNTGYQNTALGSQTLFNLSSGARNVAVGTNAGYLLTTSDGNTLIGEDAGSNLTSGSHNTILGRYNGAGIATSDANIILSDGYGNVHARFDVNRNLSIGTLAEIPTPGSRLDIAGGMTMRGISGGSISTAWGQGKIYYDSTANKFKVSENNGGWVDLVGAGGGGTITNVTAGNGLTGGGAGGAVTLDVVGGTGIVVNANDIAIDSGLGASQVPMVGGTALGASGVVVANGMGTALMSLNCANGQTIKFNVSGYANCGNDNSPTGTEFLQNGNTFGAPAVIGTNEAQPLYLETDSTNKMTILPNGNVGIGTTNPTSPLHVKAPTGLTQIESTSSVPAYLSLAGYASIANNGVGSIQFKNMFNGQTNSVIDGGTESGGVTTGSLRFSTGGGGTITEKMRISSDGNVGIGTTSPTTALEVARTVANANGGNHSVSKFDLNINTLTNSTGNAVDGLTSNVTHLSSGGADTGSYNALAGNLYQTGSGSLTNAIAVVGYLLNSAGTLTTASAVNGKVQITGGTVTTAYGGNFSVVGSTIPTTGYGVYVGTVNGTANNRYSIYASDAAAPSYFAGDVDITRHVKSTGSYATVSACGTAPTIGSSTDLRGKVTVGTGATNSSCLITFGTPYSSPPICVVSWQNGAAWPAQISSSTTNNALTVHFSTNVAGVTFSYICMQ